MSDYTQTVIDLRDALAETEAENERLREFLDWVLDAERAEQMDAYAWANEAFEKAERVRDALHNSAR